jgi:L-rhamnose mutarotase
MNQYCLTLDLKNDPELIAEYIDHHQKVWPEIVSSIKDSGIESMDIYYFGNRLCMFIKAAPGFSFEKKALMDNVNPKVQEWETLMLKYQQYIAGADKGGKWVLMEKIFELL